MKKRRFSFLLALILTLILATGCKSCQKTPPTPPNPNDDKPPVVTTKEYTLDLKQTEITLKVSEVATYDFKALFTLKLNGDVIAIDDILITNNVVAAVGNYTYTVSINNLSKTLKVTVIADPVEDVISVKALQEKVTLKEREVATYNFKALFSITLNGNTVEVKDEYLNTNNFVVGNNELICTYEGHTAKVNIEVLATTYEIELKVSEITINKSLVATYDFKALFTFKIDGEVSPITDDMIENKVVSTVGTYTYTVSIKDVKKVLTVKVTNDHTIEIVKAYQEITIGTDEVATYDYASLFMLYVDGKAIKVTSQMIDTTALNNATAGKSYKISLTYQIEQAIKTEEITINVVTADAIIINAKDIVIYPNSEHIDLRTLFTITKGSNEIEVTYDMIEGSIDYAHEGINTITITYKGITKSATVEIRKGVSIETPHGDVIIIAKGTKQDEYDFASDFKVIINGVVFDSIPEAYILLNEVNFNEVGEYAVTLHIPYNDKTFGMSGAQFVYYDKTITYKVVANQYSIRLQKDEVRLPNGTTKYNVFDNVIVFINGVNQVLTDNKDYVSLMSCYAKVVSEPINFNFVGMQKVSIEIYVNGVNEDPVLVEYNLIIESDIVIDVNNTIIFTGDTIYTKDLFAITSNGEEVEVTADMISGKFDPFTPGIYYITISYMGLEKTARIVVYDEAIKGVYHTDFTTIPPKEDDDTDDEDYGEYYDPEIYSLALVDSEQVTSYGDLIIAEDGSITFNNVALTIIDGIDENTLLVQYRSNQYTLHIENGIITLDPDNSIRLQFHNDKRPLVYFSEKMWTIDSKVVINSTSSYVLQNAINCYSIDIFYLTSNIDNTKFVYGMKTNLVEKTSSDTRYVITFGEVKFASDFKMETGISSSLTFDNEVYKFTMASENIGKIDKAQADEDRQYINMTFDGEIDGKKAQLITNQYQAFYLYIEGKLIFDISSSDVSGLENGGIDYATNTIFLYGFGNDEAYSYKFIVNPTLKTFEYIPRDKYYGKYIGADMMIFMDGYGSGVINFNTKSYYTTPFTYDVVDNYVTIKYHNTKPTFAYGDTGSLYIDALLNVLTVKDLNDDTLKDIRLENIDITDGAIVRIKSLKIGKGTDAIAKPEFFRNIQIITKDGEMSYEEKVNCIICNTVQFGKEGFYQFTIKITVAGEEVISTYAIQVLNNIYENNPVVDSYGEGVIYKDNNLTIDKYGQVTLVVSDVRYEGMIKINGDMSFIAHLTSQNGGVVKMTGHLVSDHIILVQATGAVNFSDYFTTGDKFVSGTDGLVLRLIVVGTKATFIVSSSETLTGEVVEVISLNDIDKTVVGAILEISTDPKKYVKINSWNDAKNGLSIADAYRGSYECDTKDDLVLDGFGSAKMGSMSGTYTLVGSTVTVVFSTDTKVYRLDNVHFTYEEVNIALDNSLVNGKTFTAEYAFYCSQYMYNATTTFIFGDNGEVTIKSESPEHDDGEDSCLEDRYSPSFASKTGVKGTYQVRGNKITINVNNVTFVFVIDNVLTVSTITCTSTTLTNNDHGYFSVGTKFNA